MARPCRSIRRVCKVIAVVSIGVGLFIVIVHLYSNDIPKVKARFPLGRPLDVNPFVTTFPRHQESHTQDSVINNNIKVKTILLWTQFFGSKSWFTGSETFQSCSVKTCRTTWDKREINHADAVVMNIRDFSSRSDLPSSRPPHQVWIVHGSEPPYYVYLNVAKFNNIFNWTSWYRSDADIFSPYGSFKYLNSSSGAQMKLSLKPLPDSPHRQFDEPLPSALNSQNMEPDPFSLHDRLVFWAASSCVNYAQRYRRVAELQKFLSVDTYGGCGKLRCKSNEAQCERTLKRYKFVLAFENGYCRDYVTEKYWNALQRQQIPIVSGGADYSLLTIPGSFIDVDNFTSVKELADFVLRVANDRELYNSFFTWRPFYKLWKPGIADWCQMCEALHDPTKQPQVYSDLKGWVAQDSCPLDSIPNTLWWKIQYGLFLLFGI